VEINHQTKKTKEHLYITRENHKLLLRSSLGSFQVPVYD